MATGHGGANTWRFREGIRQMDLLCSGLLPETADRRQADASATIS